VFGLFIFKVTVTARPLEPIDLGLSNLPLLNPNCGVFIAPYTVGM
jgi:hypothetical protein